MRTPGTCPGAAHMHAERAGCTGHCHRDTYICRTIFNISSDVRDVQILSDYTNIYTELYTLQELSRTKLELWSIVMLYHSYLKLIAIL